MSAKKQAGARRYTGLQIRLPGLKGPETHSHESVIGIFLNKHEQKADASLTVVRQSRRAGTVPL